ncbi:TolC family protein [Chitinophagaceae bacterium MMS25-I14]
MSTSCKGKRMLLCAWLFSATAIAQPATYTLGDLVQAAQTHLPALQQKQALIQMAEAGITDAKHAALPSLRAIDEVTVSSANSLPGSYFTMGIVPSTSGAVRSSENTNAATGNIGTLYSEYELYNFGLNGARTADARAGAALGRSDYERQLYLVKSDLARMYFSILKYQSRIAADQQNTDRYQAILTVIGALTKAGIKPAADSLQALAELSKARTSYNQSATAITQLTQQLAAYTGIAPEQISLDTNVLHISEQPQSLPGIVLEPRESNPLTDFYKRQQDLYRADDKLIRKTYLPKFTLVGALWGRASSITYNDHYDDLNTGLGYQRFNYAAGITFSYNLFDLVHRKDKLAVNRYKMQACDYALQQETLNLQTASAQANAQVQTAVQNLGEISLQEHAAQDVFNQKKAQYKAGLVNLIDLTNAAFVLYRSQTDYIETLNDWYLAQLDKAVATGNLDQFIQSIK